jgi:hypothetical protein
MYVVKRVLGIAILPVFVPHIGVKMVGVGKILNGNFLQNSTQYLTSGVYLLGGNPRALNGSGKC